MQITRIGGPTVLLEVRGWRILVDPTFDPPGRRYRFALGAASVKEIGPAVEPDGLGPVDAVLISHDHHADNLDDAGRRLLPDAPTVVTTESGARRLGLPNAVGLRAGRTMLLRAAGKETLEVTATPCRHGPPLSARVVGEVIGFTLRRPGDARYDVWVTGDTVRCRSVRRFARTHAVDVAVVHAGGVRFGITGPVRYSMTGTDAVRLIRDLRPRVAVPAHFDGWSHFRDGEPGMRSAVERADFAVRSRIRWLADGVPTPL